ncbi:MAG: nucleoside-diphosphate sugar epimerase [Anaerolineaceae bacterium 4572_78]|nr:MAG: nucleoside-diphosphate sugar epimerase [Anaerolineaceae bacterium 4572_78]
MKIVITGALGHIGSRLIRVLPNMFPAAEITLLDNLMTQRYCSIFNLPTNGNYRFEEADILTADLATIFSGAEVVIHLAALTDAAGSFEKRGEVEQINFVGTEGVARACIHAGCAMFFPSTTSVYGSQKNVVDETCSQDELKPQSPYAESKLKAERMLAKLGETDDLRFVTCRFGTIIGTSIGMRFHTAINKFCWQAVMGKPITVWQTALHQYRPYLDLSDAVSAIKFIIKNRLYDKKIYNVVTTNATVNDIVETIKTVIPSVSITHIDTKIMNQLSYHVRNDRFKDLGFEFQGDMVKGIKDTIQLLNGVQHDKQAN